MNQETETLTVILTSKCPDVPDLKLTEGDTMFIGRNPIAKIKNLKCPRKLYQIELRAEASNWFVFLTNLKTNETGKVKEGETIKGPGFEYEVAFDKVKHDSEPENISILENNSSIRKSCDNDDQDSTIETPSKKVKLDSPVKKIMEDNQPSHWEEIDEGSVQIFHFLGGGNPSSKVACFDFDGTLVSVKSGAKFPKDGNDWKLWDRTLPGLIGKYTDSGHRFVIFSNQKGVSTGQMPFDNVKQRVESCLTAIGIPCIVFLALKDNIYRKPRPGMWYLLQNCYNDLIDIDYEESFYVGDAAGRKTALNKDHSCADLLFAINNELAFLTPEQLRVGKKPKKMGDINTTLHKLPSFNPRTLRDSKAPFAIEVDLNGMDGPKYTDFKEILDKINLISSNGTHCIIFIGLPGAGKSTFFTERLAKEGYHRISRDELGTMEKCERAFEKHVKDNSSSKAVKLVVDNLNTDAQARGAWLNLCKTHNLTPIAFHFNISREHALHNNTYRRILNQMRKDSASPAVPDWLISNHAKNFVAPASKEGFPLILKINFQPSFGDRDDREIALYYMFLNDK